MQGKQPSGSRRRKHNSRRSRFVVGGMDAQTANDHILAEGLIDDDTPCPVGRDNVHDGALATGADPRSDGSALVACQSI